MYDENSTWITTNNLLNFYNLCGFFLCLMAQGNRVFKIKELKNGWSSIMLLYHRMESYMLL